MRLRRKVGIAAWETPNHDSVAGRHYPTYEAFPSVADLLNLDVEPWPALQCLRDTLDSQVVLDRSTHREAFSTIGIEGLLPVARSI